MFHRASAAVVVLASITLVACSEHAAIVAYFEQSQSIAERMVAASTEFETVMSAQENPAEWSNEAKEKLSGTIDALTNLRNEADDMSVPEAFTGVHPLLVQSLDRMIAAIKIIDDIALDPAIATMDMANEMTQKAEEGERLASEYITQLEQILQKQYPELIEE